MSGPWEDYAPTAAPVQDGPWNDYQPQHAGGSKGGSASQAPGARAAISRAEKIGHGMMDPINGGAQLLTHLLPGSVVQAGNRLNNWLADKTGLVARLPEGGVDQQVQQDEAAYQAQRAAAGETGLDGYRLLGNALSPANLAIASRVPAAASLAGRIGAGAGAGGVSATLAPVASGDFWSEKGKQAAAGAITGGLVPALGAGLSRVINPRAANNPSLQLLKDEGVRPTIGQALGGRWNALEEKLQSVPILGDSIAMARGRALDDFNKAAINRASGKVGVQVNKTGQDGVRAAGDAVSQAYDDALGKITGVQLDGQFNRNLMQLRGMAQGLTTDMRKKFNTAVNETLMRKVSRNGSILPDDFKAIDSEIGNMAARFGKSQVASEQELGDALSQLQSLLKQQMVRSNPQVAQELAAADAGWANLVRVEGAAKAGKNAEGLFTPAQLNAAIQAADQSVRKRAVARGTALMQDLGGAGQSVLGNKVPNSFTTDRALIAGGAMTSGLVNPAIPLGLLGGAGLYTSPAQRALVALASSRGPLAQPAAQAVQQASPFLIPGAVGLGLQLTP